MILDIFAAYFPLLPPIWCVGENLPQALTEIGREADRWPILIRPCSSCNIGPSLDSHPAFELYRLPAARRRAGRPNLEAAICENSKNLSGVEVWSSLVVDDFRFLRRVLSGHTAWGSLVLSIGLMYGTGRYADGQRGGREVAWGSPF